MAFDRRIHFACPTGRDVWSGRVDVVPKTHSHRSNAGWDECNRELAIDPKRPFAGLKMASKIGRARRE